MADESKQRYVLLNHLVSRSVTRARGDVSPPLHSGMDLLRLIAQRQAMNWAVEYPGGTRDDEDAKRVAANAGRTSIRIRSILFDDDGAHRYATLLVEHVDASARAFPVVHQTSFLGRELSGDAEERGATAAHIVVRMPMDGQHDDGKYRCVVEAVHGVSRKLIEYLLCRQIRRVSDAGDWSFDATRSGRKGKPVTTKLHYTPRLELHADVFRQIGGGSVSGRVLSSMKFVKRSERQNVAQPTDVEHSDFDAAVTMVVKAEEGPLEPSALHRWAANIRTAYEQRGYKTSLSFRHAAGTIEQGNVHSSIDGATDLLLCSRELVDYAGVPKLWVPQIDNAVASQLKDVCNREEIWPPSPQR